LVFVITMQWLEEHRSQRGAWTADQFQAIGLAWPPPRGWKRRVIGKEISDEARARFEKAMRAKAARADATLDLFALFPP
jgi:hypothetical protein